MNYKLVYTHRAVKDFQKLDEQNQNRIARKLMVYKENPLKYSSKLSNPSLGMYRFRIGDYRVVFDICDSDIVILRMGHRKAIYRKI